MKTDGYRGPHSVQQLGYTESWVGVLRGGDSFRLGIKEGFREEVAFGLSPGVWVVIVWAWMGTH